MMLFLLFFLKSLITKHRPQVLMAQPETIFVLSTGEAGHDLLIARELPLGMKF